MVPAAALRAIHVVEQGNKVPMGVLRATVGLVGDEAPPWAYERAELLSPPDKEWSRRAEIERHQLLELLAPWLVDGIEHMPAVPGLAVKPIIDFMASVTDPDLVVVEAAEALAGGGWHYVPSELDRRAWRRFFVKPDPSGQKRAAHLHVIGSGHPRWAEQMAFRDALRRDNVLARQYEELKRRLSHRYGDDREADTESKVDFIRAVLRRGRQ
jgi:GrpB-like predicted nucleotidyltransferase (UPF0157 family)